MLSNVNPKKHQLSIYYSVYVGCFFFLHSGCSGFDERKSFCMCELRSIALHTSWLRVKQAVCFLFEFYLLIVRSSVCKCCGLTFLLALIEALQRFFVVCFEARVGVVVVLEEKRRGEGAG